MFFPSILSEEPLTPAEYLIMFLGLRVKDFLLTVTLVGAFMVSPD